MANLTQYTPEQVNAGLLALIYSGGNHRKAAEAIESANLGYRIPAETLRKWKDNRAARYYELMAEHAEEIEKRLEHSKRETLTKIAAGLQQSVDKTLEQLDNGDVKDPSSVARNLAVVSGIETRDLLLLSGRPTQVVEHYDADALLRKLQDAINVTAEEIPDVEAISERSEGND